MMQHPIYLSDTVYQLLSKRAAQERVSLEQIAERLLSQELTADDLFDDEQTQDASSALEAVERLSMLFEDIDVEQIEQTLNDPMLEMASTELDAILL